METPEPRNWKWIQVAVVMAALIIGVVLAVWVENRPITPVNVQSVPLPVTDARRLNLPDIIPSVAPEAHATSTTQVTGGQLDGSKLDGSQIDGASGVATGSDKSLDPVVAGTPSADTLASPAYGGARAALSGQTSSGSAPTALPGQSSASSYMPSTEGTSSTIGQSASSPAETLPGAQPGTSVSGSPSSATASSTGVPTAYSPAGAPATGSSSTTTGGF